MGSLPDARLNIRDIISEGRLKLILKHPRSDFQVSPLAATLFRVNWLRELVLDQDDNLYLISLNILIACLLDDLWILQGEVTC